VWRIDHDNDLSRRDRGIIEAGVERSRRQGEPTGRHECLIEAASAVGVQTWSGEDEARVNPRRRLATVLDADVAPTRASSAPMCG